MRYAIFYLIFCVALVAERTLVRDKSGGGSPVVHRFLNISCGITSTDTIISSPIHQ